MSFKTRLIFSYVIMIILPIILTVIAALIIVALNLRIVAGTYGFDYSGNPVKEFLTKSQLVYNDINMETSKNPDKLLDKAYLSDQEKKLKPLNTGIIVRKDNDITYCSQSLNNINLNDQLPGFGTKSTQDVQRVTLGKKQTAMRHIDFYFSDKSRGTIFLATDITPVMKSAQRVVTYVCIAIILILITTNGFLTFFVSRSVLKPIKTLKNAAYHIQEGDLNFEVKTSSKDEIGQLCVAFENMRQKLKESIDLQIQYESNRKELISNISHDLKTPVTAIKGYVEGIIDGVANNPAKMDRYLKTIYSRATDLDELIDELFLFSKLDLNKLPFNFEKVKVGMYLEDCVEVLRLDLEKNNITLNLIKEKENDSVVLMDREKMKRVIMNIVGNSAKYMDKSSGKIDIVLKDEEDKVRIEVKDNGSGISEEDISMIFDRFYRADPSRNCSTGGSGLGLAIVKRIVEEHGGKVWAESKLGEGTSIFFTLRKI